MRTHCLLAVLLLALVLPRQGRAIPAFARKHNFHCTVCHTAPLELTPFGKTFKENGLPSGDGEVVPQGQDLGQGVVLDPLPGTVVRLKSWLLTWNGGDEVGTRPFRAVEFIAAGQAGPHWNAMFEFSSTDSDGYVPTANG